MKSSQPLPVACEPADVASSVAFVISDVTGRCITGANIEVDGGLRMGNAPHFEMDDIKGDKKW